MCQPLQALRRTPKHGHFCAPCPQAGFGQTRWGDGEVAA
jgi:hypothetical protein